MSDGKVKVGCNMSDGKVNMGRSVRWVGQSWIADQVFTT